MIFLYIFRCGVAVSVGSVEWLNDFILLSVQERIFSFIYFTCNKS
jgi:hypothetical protein